MSPGRRWPLTEALVIAAAIGASLLAAGWVLTNGKPTDTVPTAAATTSVPMPTATPSTSPPATVSTVRGISALPDADWVSTTARAAGIPERAMAAYAGATLAIADDFPACGLGWNTLAAIGWVETHHGTYKGSTIDADGVARPTIVGIPLNGSGTLTVRDTDGGALDGDTTWDRAVGPMQFIPSTWAQYGRDGDGDGTADVNHIDDAALAAAAYLCHAGGDLTDDANWIRAVGAYNPSVDYNHKVADAADTYAAFG